MLNLLRIIETFRRERRERIQEDEVVARLSFSTWKTCNRILEEIENHRIKSGRPKLPGVGEAYFYTPKSVTVSILNGLSYIGEVDIRTRSEIVGEEASWVMESESDADERDLARNQEGNLNAKLMYYRFASECDGGKGNKQMESVGGLKLAET